MELNMCFLGPLVRIISYIQVEGEGLGRIPQFYACGWDFVTVLYDFSVLCM